MAKYLLLQSIGCGFRYAHPVDAPLTFQNCPECGADCQAPETELPPDVAKIIGRACESEDFKTAWPRPQAIELSSYLEEFEND